MPKVYTVPPDMKEKEKIIGGVLDMSQFLWLVSGFVSGIILCLIVWVLTGIAFISISLALINVVAVLPFVFYKKQGLPLWDYLKRKKAFDKKSKKLINKRKGAEHQW